ncbi:MAG: tRNA pseudouridine(55) synthase TruB [Flavobacteriales bacterium]|nr:tRNA pseudouridine(55) synthase TruB [Flavobacteriales bacterium]MBK9077541.1 tRNA pseudouridine(55) synthase TruB [Flavobacteriales bacterium]MBP6389998.1 tRNA pseudouridine(55) synthase TruB [Flavobacteriales bacterium]MBP6696887.1 tRNA pseudouridine(55) synthase TruB [Flavobacteriales bacterium]
MIPAPVGLNEPVDLEAGGLLLVDKPVTWTSFNAVAKIRSAMRAKAGHKMKVGHGGTLDPLASGLLILGFGRGTKSLLQLTGLDKRYTGTLTLGGITPSQDAETEVVEQKPWAHLDEASVRNALARFVGPLQQRPPIYSAKHHQGERAYWKARDGREAEMELASVLVHRLELLSIDGPLVTFDTTVSKGTYVRTLAHDIGQVLGCGAYLSALRRTHIDRYDVADALDPMAWAQRIAPRG